MSPGCSLGRCLDGGQPWHMQHVFLSAHWRTQRQLAVLAARLIFHGSVVCLSVVYPLPIQPFCLRVWVWFVCQSVRFCFWTHVHAQMHTHTVMHTHTYTLAKRHACTHTRHTHTHARAKTHTHTHAHAHTHSCTPHTASLELGTIIWVEFLRCVLISPNCDYTCMNNASSVLINVKHFQGILNTWPRGVVAGVEVCIATHCSAVTPYNTCHSFYRELTLLYPFVIIFPDHINIMNEFMLPTSMIYKT